MYTHTQATTLPLYSNRLDCSLRGTHNPIMRIRGRCLPLPPNPDDLQLRAQHFLNNSLAANTRSTYSTGQQQFKVFCQAIKVNILPASEATLTLFITYLATEKISHKSLSKLISLQCATCMFQQACSPSSTSNSYLTYN